jgi:hypothetical protein
MTTTAIDLETLLPWGAPKTVQTKAGKRYLRSAAPDENFWGLWNADKQALKDAGISLGQWPKNSGKWVVNWWSQPTAEEVAAENKAIEASRATDLDIEVPVPEGLAYLPFQKAGIAYALQCFGVDLSETLTTSGSKKDANWNLQANAGNESGSDDQSLNGTNSKIPCKSESFTTENSEGSKLEDKGQLGDAEKNASAGHPQAAHGGTSKSENKELSGGKWGHSSAEGSGFGNADGTDGIHNGISNPDSGPQHDAQSAHVLQSGFWPPGKKDSGGGGWPIAPQHGCPTIGSEKVGSPKSVGLASSSNKTLKEKGNCPSVRGCLIADEMGL